MDDTIVSGSLGTFTGARDMAWFEETGSKALAGINMVLAYTFHPHSFLSQTPCRTPAASPFGCAPPADNGRRIPVLLKLRITS